MIFAAAEPAATSTSTAALKTRNRTLHPLRVMGFGGGSADLGAGIDSSGADRFGFEKRFGFFLSLLQFEFLGVGVFLFLTGLGDFWGGRRNFLIGMGGATVFTLLFAVGGGFPIFTLAWVGNRLTQSIGWAGLIKVSSRWFDYSVYGTVIGILSISYLIGDAAARQSMGMLLAHGFGWRALFVYAAIVVGLASSASTSTPSFVR